MNPLEETYTAKFFKNRHKLSWRVPIVCNAIMDVFNPKSIVDVGCGIGDYVRGFIDKDIIAYGIEGSLAAEPYLVIPRSKIFFTDLRTPIAVENKFDIAMCFEVAEHIEKEYVEAFLDNLIRLSDTIIMSAAPPGARGHSHVNCQSARYWKDKFDYRDYYTDCGYMMMMYHEWRYWKDKKEMSSYYHNLLVFKKG